MEHDPLCLLPTSCEQYPDGHPRAKRFYCDDCEIDCECYFIAEVRADERERAAQRVSACEPWSLRTISAEDAVEAARRSW